jgi:hypothetical protein
MATAAQHTANQSNAQLSTGPRTVEGKSRVAQNALRHGLTAKHLVIRDDEHEEFQEFQNSLAAELQPQGALETFTFQELLHAAWNLHRFRRIEARCSCGTAKDLIDPEITVILDRLGRYQARAQRAYYKALQQLRTLQTDRALRALKLTEEELADVPPVADIRKLTKQTRSSVPAKAKPLALPLAKQENATSGIALPDANTPSFDPQIVRLAS